MKKTFKLDSFESVNRFLNITRYTILNTVLKYGSCDWSLITEEADPIIEAPDDIERIRKEVRETLLKSKSPCVRQAYSLDAKG